MPKLRGNNKKDRWGIRLKAILKEKKLTFRKAAAIAGVSASVIDSWTNGATPSDLHAVKRLSDHLQVDFTWLLLGEHDKTTHIPPVTELYDEQIFFDGLARIRIDRLIPKK